MEKEENISEEEVEKVYEVILRRVKKTFHENVDIKIIPYDSVACSKTLGVKITIDSKVDRLHFISKNEDGRREYIMTTEKISKRSVVESLLKAAAEHEVRLYGNAVLRREETLERLLIEDDLLKK